MSRINKQWGSKVVWIGLFLACSVLCQRTEAQVSAAKLSGTIADTSGATIAGAKIEITNVQTGITRNVLSNSSGLYSAPGLPPGNYTVSVSQESFATEVRTGITLDVGSDQLLNITLRVGTLKQEVAVSDIAAGVDLTTSTLNAVVDGKNVRELPLNGRSWTDLAALTTGVTVIQTQPPVTASDRPKRGLGAQLSISGGRPQQNSYLLDGININDYSNAGPGSVLGGNLGVDAIQEFTVITTNPVAQYGRTSGGVISAITRSGTNQIHGSAYEFVRDASLDAKNYFDQGSIPPFRRHQFGGSLGGPIQKNKTFIFGDYEGVRQNLGTTALQQVPSAAARAGFVGGVQVTPDPQVARFINAFYPLPNGTVNGDIGDYSFAGTQLTTENFFTVKADHTFSPKDSVAVTYLFDDNPSSQNDEFNNKVILSKTRRQLVSILENHIFSPSTLNSAHIGYSRDNAGSPYAATAI
ncbi:MAG TPA: carboxypeptidase regulatory-like domain-containing protein, partial [Chthoniobacterales bacterium]